MVDRKLMENTGTTMTTTRNDRMTLAEFKSAKGSVGSKKGRPKNSGGSLVKFKQEAIIDFLLLHPHAKQVDIARHFGVTSQYVSNIMASDAFQGSLNARRTELTEKIDDRVMDSVKGLFHASVDRMTKELEVGSVPFAEQRETCFSALSAMGYSSDGKNEKAREQTVVNVNVISQEELELARSRMRDRDAGAEAKDVSPRASVV